MRFIIFTLIFLGCSTMAIAEEATAVVVREATVYADADNTASRVSRLKAGTEVNVLGRQGGWKEIYSDKLQVIGWVRSFQVREVVSATVSQATEKSDSRGFLAGLASLSRKASGFFGLGSGESATSASTATIGVRGLSEEEIKSAEADFKQLRKMKSYVSNPKRQKSFASKGKLKSNKVAYIKK